jgi:hypothetical protein
MRSSVGSTNFSGFRAETTSKRIVNTGRSAAAITLVPESAVGEAYWQEPCALSLPEPDGSPGA